VAYVVSSVVAYVVVSVVAYVMPSVVPFVVHTSYHQGNTSFRTEDSGTIKSDD
jgi:hypothetical protein